MSVTTLPVRASGGGASRRKLLSDPKHWVAQAGLWTVTALLIAAHQGTLLTYGFPCLAIAAGLWLYFMSPARYVGFMWWMWFLSPEVRRLADWSKGAYTPTSLIQIAPLAVTMIAGLGLLRHYRVLAERRGLPVLLILFGLMYAFLVGVVSSGPLAAIYDLANWLYPVLIGFHIVVHSRDYPEYRKVILSTFVWGMLVMGVYGIVQFFVMPKWDVLWMVGSQMSSQGDPVPYGVRVFSTMNSSGPFAFAMMGALVFMIAATERVRWIAGAAGFLSFCLCLVRSTWGGWVIALVIQLAKSSNRVRVRIIGSAIVLAALCVPLLTVGPVADRLGQRLQSITNLKDDRSYDDRNKFYATFAQTAFTDVAGEGLGATGASTKLSSSNGDLGKYGSFDSGVMNVPFVLGWPGTLLYLFGLVWLLGRVLRASFRLRRDKFVAACLSLSLSVFAMLVFTNSFIGTGGLLLFMSIFSILSAAHWQKLQRASAARFPGADQ
ncbi:glucose-6-phosphate isomerase [Burkholderia oklahomensis]|uniref:glucose-6-phosphate isomerase n=1 Tax=Burkholderia oklahomensis TaxID=342113 RepID=UPI00016A912F|nr:glucose-6-phosphate isomerase [Burkholderia oklahomensis]AJX35382.1 O-antigen ligase like membrane family protein [Burkholderia oklahomensis C6786]AOI50142.1 glucose-6-phosphate isomerase [Burkholderia oklahomensis C6786]KUY52622.1 glucose-6-phosphate isomerase [Burkholderia oklahomensis C6786]MBI0363539.1 glucose-6-phosphate isomerase [Burkholderia oklahomensis]SUY27661.1 Lipid A core - O-antigen ligase and related enzymes [Burkholderia oklahomensis]